MMVYQTRAVWLLLLLTAVESLIFQQTTYEIDKPRGDDYLISSDVLRQNTVLFATITKTSRPALGFNVDVTLGEKSNSIPKQCSLSLTANINAESVGLNSLMRYEEKVLLETYEQIKNGNRYTTLVFLDMSNCQIKFPLPSQLSEKVIVHKRYLYDIRFEVFTADRAICRRVGDKCRIRYREYNTTIIEPFHVDLVWSSLRIEQTFKDDVYLMCGLNGSGKYQVELHRFEKNYNFHKELVSLSYVEGMQIITSDLAFCWILDTKKEHTTVYCSQFDQKGALIFSSTITYQKRVKLVFLYSVSRGKIVLLTGSDQTSLSRIYITMVERDNFSEPIDDHQIDLACTSSATQTVFAASNVNNVIKIVYVCLRNNKFQYNTISIPDK